MRSQGAHTACAAYPFKIFDKGAKGKQQYAMLFSYAEKAPRGVCGAWLRIGKKHSIQGTTRGALLKSKILKG